MINTLNKSKSFIIKIMYVFLIMFFIFFNASSFDSSFKITFNVFIIIFMQILTFIVFGLDIISSISLLTIWILIPTLMLHYVGYNNYGLVSLGLFPIDVYLDTFYVFIFIFMLSFSSYIFNINNLEKRILNIKLPTLKSISILINNMIAVIFSFVAFPSIPSFGGIAFNANERFQMLLPGHAWNQLAIVALIFNMPYLFKSKGVLFTYIVTIFWFLSHGERADISGLLLGILVIVFCSKKIKNSKKIISLFIVILFVLLLIGIGFERTHGYFPGIIDDFNNLSTFSTVSDVSYLLNASVDYIKNFGFTHGQITISTIISAIPLFSNSKDAGYFLNLYYPYPGGISILSVPLMEFGIIGIIIMTPIYSFLVKQVVDKNSSFFKYEFLVLICSIPRISWYGINYVFTSMLFFVPFIYIINNYFNLRNKG